MRFADELTSHYAHHPALIAVGYNNEIGDGYMSYSDAVRQRFIEWLKAKYGTVAKPQQGMGDPALVAAAELVRRGAAAVRRRTVSRRNAISICAAFGRTSPFQSSKIWKKSAGENVPDLPAVSNLWPTSDRMGFDYLSSYRNYVELWSRRVLSRYAAGRDARAHCTIKGELSRPLWFNEFVTGGGGTLRRPERHRPHVGLPRPLRLRANVSGLDLQHAPGRRRAGALRSARPRRHSRRGSTRSANKLPSEFSKLQTLRISRAIASRRSRSPTRSTVGHRIPASRAKGTRSADYFSRRLLPIR